MPLFRRKHTAVPAPQAQQGMLPAQRRGHALDLGTLHSGFIYDEQVSWVQGNRLTIPASSGHLICLGLSQMGKSTTLLKLCAEAAHAGEMVWYWDGKGSEDGQLRFWHLMEAAYDPRQLGREPVIRLFPWHPYDGWRGPDLTTLFVELFDWSYTPEYYKNYFRAILQLATSVPGLPLPTSSQELLARLDADWLEEHHANTSGEELLARIAADRNHHHLREAYTRLSGFTRSLGGLLDGAIDPAHHGWAFESVDACYVRLDGLGERELASQLARYLVIDLEKAIKQRKPNTPSAGRRVLLAIDDLGAIARAVDVTNLLERIGEYQTRLLISAQNEEGLGPHDIPAKALKSCKTRILHQLPDPERVVQAGGTEDAQQMAHTISADRLTLQYRPEETLRVDPNVVRALAVGEVVVIHANRSARVWVEAAPDGLTPAELAAGRQYLAEQEAERVDGAAAARERVYQRLKGEREAREAAKHQPQSHPQQQPKQRPGKQQQAPVLPVAPAPPPGDDLPYPELPS